MTYLRYEPNPDERPSPRGWRWNWLQADPGWSYRAPADGAVGFVDGPDDTLDQSFPVKKGDIIKASAGGVRINGVLHGSRVVTAASIDVDLEDGENLLLRGTEGEVLLLGDGEEWGEDVHIGGRPGDNQPMTIKRPMNTAAAQSFNDGVSWPALFILVLHDRLVALEQQIMRLHSAMGMEEAP